MDRAVAKLVEKISTYQILNYMIPGSVLCLLLKYFVGYDLLTFSVIENIVVVYFVGMVNSRLSSLVLKPLLKKTKVINEADHKEFIIAEKEDAKLTLLSDMNNSFRSIANAMLILLLAYIIKHISVIETFVLENINWIAIVSLLILFILSYRRQTEYVTERVEVDNSVKK